MFSQVITGKIKDVDLLERQMDRWVAEIKPGIRGFLGSTGGVTPDGRAVVIARFESAEAAAANNGNPLQDAWWNETVKAYDGEPTFYNCTDVDVPFDNGADKAGFVQVIQGRVTDTAKVRQQLLDMVPEVRKQRPDLLGMAVSWHGDGGFTQAVYFKSEKEARKNEAATESSSTREEYQAMFAGPPTFYDLTDPQLL